VCILGDEVTKDFGISRVFILMILGRERVRFDREKGQTGILFDNRSHRQDCRRAT
jgi:hypothetical protein